MSLSDALAAALPAGGDAAFAGSLCAGSTGAVLTPYLRATLNAGVRYSQVQQAAYAAVAADTAAQATLQAINGKVGAATPFLGGAAISAADGAALGAVYDLLTLAYPYIETAYPAVAAWTAAVVSHPAVAAVLAERRLATGGVRRVGGQRDLRASPAAVAALADASVARNAGHKKAATQRDLEDAEREAKKAAAATAAAAPPAPAPAAVAAAASQPEANKTLPSLPVDERIALALSKLSALAGVEGLGVVRHAPADNVEALLSALAGRPGVPAKNLFVKAKKEKPGNPADSRMWLVVAAHDTKVDLVGLASKLGYGKIVIRFDTPESLGENLGVAPGNVSPLALANDAALRVQVAIDARLLAADAVWVHPLTNEASVALAPAALSAFIAATGHAVTVVDFSA